MLHTALAHGASNKGNQTFIMRNSVPTLAGERGGGAGNPVEVTRALQSGRGPTARLCCICFCLFRQYYYLSIVQINVFRPNSSPSATDSLSVVKVSSRSAHGGAPEIFSFLFSEGFKAAVGGREGID